MATPKFQSLKDLRTEMIAVARGERAPAEDAADISFESADAVTRLLTPENRHLLDVIDTQQPESVAQLASLVGRAESNVSRTLAKLVEAGFVVLLEGEGRSKVPKVKIREITIRINALKWKDQLLEAR